MARALTKTPTKATDKQLTPEVRILVNNVVRELLETHLIGPEEIIRKKDLPKYLGIGKTAIDEMIKEGRLREGVCINDGRAVGWFASWVVECQQKLKDEAEAKAKRRGTNV
jgi:predicted DNA-binding transcriptional regulator AlpA